ncbi:unnamed protein product [Chrysodeixis includens]|uniref:Uncharacterized protein n=1 Tax=Chrysodeixis includens TaxID=689277 RepID=A0A9N8L607_CHRIL|nr:unnamed protein product [Chrysodeixis includens]
MHDACTVKKTIAMLFESPNAKLFPAFNIPPPVRLSDHERAESALVSAGCSRCVLCVSSLQAGLPPTTRPLGSSLHYK